MMPTLGPGDQVLVDPKAFADRRPQRDDVVLAKHPFQPTIMVKRVADVVEDGVILVGDNPSGSTDSRGLGRIRFEAILGSVQSRIG